MLLERRHVDIAEQMIAKLFGIDASAFHSDQIASPGRDGDPLLDLGQRRPGPLSW